MEANTMIKVSNRSSGTVVYNVPELNIRRQFNVGETKVVPFKELEAVSYQQGGRALLYHFLLIQDENALRQLINGKEEPEYWLTENKIPGWLNSCSLDEFTDALNFAPEGVKDLIKQYSVSVPLNDVSKRKKVLEILAFDVDSAVKNAEADKEEEKSSLDTPVRITAPIPGKTERKTAPQYKIVKPEIK